MGTIKHNSIVVVGSDLKKIRKKAVEIFRKNGNEKLVSELINDASNSKESFFVSPDGSKEGWKRSNDCDEARAKLCKYLDKQRCDYVEIEFGGDDDNVRIINNNN